MSEFWFIVREGKYFTRGTKFTDNFNLAYLYGSKEEAEDVANEIGGEIRAYKRQKWVVVKDNCYLSYGGKFVKDLNEAYLFSKSTANQYAQELKGQAVQVLSE